MIYSLTARPLLLGPDDLDLPAGGPAELLARVEAAGLRGRGGAAFPLAVKLRTVAAAGLDAGRPPVVVANGEEGEPGSVKDRHLMRTRPHLVLDGLAHAAAIVGAVRRCVYVSDPASAASIREAIAARADDGGETEVVEVAPAYVAGEETAVVRFIDGGPALPVAKPPRPYERGVGGAPTLISNVETLVHLALLARGVDATGHLLLTVAGTGVAPALVEVAAGTRLRDALTAIGVDPRRVRGALMGGMFGGLAGAGVLDAPLSPDALRAAGSALGCGAVHLLTDADCPVDLAADALAYLGAQSARQCGVCVSGTSALAATVARLRAGTATPDDLAKIERWSLGLPGRGACGLLDAAGRVGGSLLRAFPGDVAAHLTGCPLCETSPARGGDRFTVVPRPAATLLGAP